tara:strand:+ start:240 stop:518 length:279 start_codon:yes stop_codon:yes gene_type:complete
LLTTTEGADAVDGALSITVLPVVLLDTVFDAVVLLTVLEEELTVLELLLIVLLVVVLVTVSVAYIGIGNNVKEIANNPSTNFFIKIILPFLS